MLQQRDLNTARAPTTYRVSAGRAFGQRLSVESQGSTAFRQECGVSRTQACGGRGRRGSWQDMSSRDRKSSDVQGEPRQQGCLGSLGLW